MLHDLQRFARLGIDQPVFGPCGDLLAEVEDDVRRVGQTRRLFEFAPRGLVKVLAGLRLGLRELVPCGQNLRVDAERSDARRNEVFIPGFGHQRELPRHDRHDRFERHDVRVVADARAGRVQRIVRQVLAQIVAQHVDEQLLAAGKEILADTAAGVIVVVVGNLLLVILPTLSFYHLLIVFVAVIEEDVHHVLLIGSLFVTQFAGLAVGVLLDGVEHLLAAADLENPVNLVE